jgi:protein-disulfide isomerase
MKPMRTLLLLPAWLLSGVLLMAQAAPAPKAPVKPPANYKEMGSPSAPITFEAYTDYECPHCAIFFRDIVPNLMAQYVQTGKVRFVHRDFPLIQIHQWAQLAARFANAAGEIGQYELVVNQIFKTQDTWSRTGNIDAEVAKVLAPGAMQKVRELVKTDSHLDESIKKDVDMALNLDHVNSTPTVVIVSKGKRTVIATVLPFSTWKSYLDEMLAKQ